MTHTEVENNAQREDRAQRAEDFYERNLRASLEPNHHGEFVAIEPDSQTFFLGRTLEEASSAARRANPGRIPYTRRVGYSAVFEIGYSE